MWIVFFSLLISLIWGMPDDMCFALTTNSSPRVVLNQTTKETARACTVACGNDDRCTAVWWNDPTCMLLGPVESTMFCTKPGNVSLKKASGCSARNDSLVGMGKDPCVSGFNSAVLKFGQQGICPRDSNNYVVRGIDEFGARVTLDNDVANVLKFNATRNMWQYYHSGTGFSKWLVAVGCATNNKACICDPLPTVRPNLAGGVAAQTDKDGTCAKLSDQFTFFGGKFKAGSATQTFKSEWSTMNITCQAGIWMLSYLDNRNGWQIVNATCAP